MVAANILLAVNVRSVAAGRMPCLLDDFSMLDCARGDSQALLVLSMVCYTSAYMLLLLSSIRPDKTRDSFFLDGIAKSGGSMFMDSGHYYVCS